MNLVRPFALFGLAVVVCAAGCGGGGSKTTGPGAVTADDLAIMVLPAWAIGQPAAAHVFAPISGFQSEAKVAEHTIDPHDTADDIHQAGLDSDYLLSYMSSTDPSVSTEVSLFDTARQASDFVKATVGQAQRYEGTSSPYGVLTHVEVAKLDRPGNTAYRATLTGSFYGEAYSTNLVGFSKDRIAGFVYLTGSPATVDALASKLSRRIDAVAAGTISDKPVTLTDPTPVQVVP